MVISTKIKKINLIIDLLSLSILIFFLGACIYLTVLGLSSSNKWSNLSVFIIGMLVGLFGIAISSWLIYQWVTKIISENFSLTLDKDFFSFKSFLFKLKIRYKDIKDVYMFVRSGYYIWGIRGMKMLKIHSSTGMRVYICLDILNKREQKLLISVLKENVGFKISEKNSFRG